MIYLSLSENNIKARFKPNPYTATISTVSHPILCLLIYREPTPYLPFCKIQLSPFLWFQYEPYSTKLLQLVSCNLLGPARKLKKKDSRLLTCTVHTPQTGQGHRYYPAVQYKT